MSDMGHSRNSEQAPVIDPMVIDAEPIEPIELERPLRQRASSPPVPPERLKDYNRLLKKLKITHDAIISLPRITDYVTKKLKLSREDVITYLEMSSESEVRSFLLAYNLEIIPDDLRERFPYELYCAVAKLSPLRLLELLAAVIVRAGAQHSAITAALRHPEVVDATVAAALLPDGVSDRITLHKATGFLPQPKGAQTTISIQAAANASAQSAAAAHVLAPPPELTIRTLVDRFNDAQGMRTPMPALAESNSHEYVPDDFDNDAANSCESVPVSVPAMNSAQSLAKKFRERELDRE